MDRFIDTFTGRAGEAELAVLMPVHNEGSTIRQVVMEYYDVISSAMPVEIVLSEDGSTDDTKERIEELSREIPLKAVLSDKRKGYAGGIIDGLKIVSSDYVLITDSDGQHDPRDIWKLWELRREYDVVSGWRVERADSLFRRIMSRTFQFMARRMFSLPSFKDITSPFKLMKTSTALDVAGDYKYMRESFWTEFIIRAYFKGYKIVEVPVSHRPRPDGSTRVYKPAKIPGIVYSQFTALLKLRKELYGRLL